MTQEELTKLLMESYKRGQSDLIKSCHETISIAVDTAILAEREACAEVCKKHADFYAGLEPSPIAQSAWAACVDNRDTIRARGQA